MRLSGLRVLLVEDEALIAMLVEEYLADLGCAVVATAARLDEAMTKAADLPIDLAVLDVNLAGRLSYPVAIRLRDRAIPFILATGYGEDGRPEDLKTAPVLTKPFRQDQLEQALLALMG